MPPWTPWNVHIDGLVLDCSNSSMLAMELPQPSAKPSIYFITAILWLHYQFLVDSCDAFTHIFHAGSTSTEGII